MSLSSTEAEYVSAATSAQDLVFLKEVISDFDIKNCKSILLVDNVSAICMATTHENSKRSKHTDIRFHFIKDLTSQNILEVKHVPTDKNVDDVMEKLLSKLKFKLFRDICIKPLCINTAN